MTSSEYLDYAYYPVIAGPCIVSNKHLKLDGFAVSAYPSNPRLFVFVSATYIALSQNYSEGCSSCGAFPMETSCVTALPNLSLSKSLPVRSLSEWFLLYVGYVAIRSKCWLIFSISSDSSVKPRYS